MSDEKKNQRLRNKLAHEAIFTDQGKKARKWMKANHHNEEPLFDEEMEDFWRSHFTVANNAKHFLRSRNEAVHGTGSVSIDAIIESSKAGKPETPTNDWLTTYKALAAITAASMLIKSTQTPTPPKLPRIAEDSLTFLLPRDRREEVMGDLEEDYFVNIVPKLGEKLARRWYWFHAIRAILHYNGVTARIIKVVEELKKSRS